MLIMNTFEEHEHTYEFLHRNGSIHDGLNNTYLNPIPGTIECAFTSQSVKTSTDIYTVHGQGIITNK